MTSITYRTISSADTIKLIRETLKIEFPGVKFSVRKTRGGSVDIQWTDGPTWDNVQSVAKFYEGAQFDSMVDLKELKYHFNEAGERVRYSIDYVLCNRHFSRETLEKAIAWYTPRYAWTNGAPDFEIKQIKDYPPYLNAKNWHSQFGTEYAGQFVIRELNKLSAADIKRKFSAD